MLVEVLFYQNEQNIEVDFFDNSMVERLDTKQIVEDGEVEKRSDCKSPQCKLNGDVTKQKQERVLQPSPKRPPTVNQKSVSDSALVKLRGKLQETAGDKSGKQKITEHR
ncbi:hypothetical protein BVRB_7g163530 [Beta vulgaris subsp. vulgaris]|nr:hypothetical protein BVRB_7g163530 [Beta vulgaris subsp. vulgaris]